MSDKTQLERAIERQELVKKPFSVFILIAFLSVSLGALGVYTFKLKQEIEIKEKEIVLLKSSFEKKKAELLNQIKRLERQYKVNGSDLEPVTDNAGTLPETKPLTEIEKKKP